jgi:pyruvate dehydrogenase E2 component (dihydrolipoamide acetyltransferase)
MSDVVTMPKLGFDMAEGTLVRWVKAEGETVTKGEVLAEIETDKATVEVESSFGGIVYRHLVEQGSIVPVGSPIAVISQPGEQVADLPGSAAPESKKETAPSELSSPSAAQTAVEVQTGVPADGMLHASPLARKMAVEKKVDLRLVRGSGPSGRIVRKDVEMFLAAGPKPAPVSTVAQPQPTPAPVRVQDVLSIPLSSWGKVEQPADETQSIDRLRLAIGRRMAESKQQVPHFYVTHEYDLDELIALRKEINTLLPDDQKLSVNDFIVKATALSLRLFPSLNSSLAGDKLLRHGSINIGVAVAVEGGLLTVVVRNADLKPLRVISTEVKEMAARARLGKVRTEDIEGSTFSISNLGMFDVEHFIAIINPPEAAILAVGSAKAVPAVVDGSIQIRTRMKATLSADHRVADGAQAAQFLQLMAEYLEKPLRLML